MELTMMDLSKLKIKIYADGADINDMLVQLKNPLVKGFTTNPTLMRKAGVTDYKKFALEAIKVIKNLPISFEVFADDPVSIYDQAKTISSWGKNVNVKIPITTSSGDNIYDVIRRLSHEGIQLNITAILTLEQVRKTTECLNKNNFSIISIFAGRIADSGIDPKEIMKESKLYLKDLPKANILWASPRQALNILEAEEVGADIITITPDLLKKADNFGKSLQQFSLETVQMFYNDAKKAGYKID